MAENWRVEKTSEGWWVTTPKGRRSGPYPTKGAAYLQIPGKKRSVRTTPAGLPTLGKKRR
jgi:hypothetical protein